MQGFDGPELVLGSIYGVRHFGWEGGLKAVSHSYVWSPGENEAVCDGPLMPPRPVKHTKRKPSCVALHGDAHAQGFLDWLVAQQLPLPPSVQDCFECEVEEPPEHGPAGNPDCQCGFWAYYGEGLDSPYGNQNRIAGVIEGYGRTTVGTKGFRCEKAKIVALMVPLPAKPKEPEPEPQPLDQKALFNGQRKRYLLWSLLVVTLPWTLWNLLDIWRAGRMHTHEECTGYWSKYHGDEWWMKQGHTCTRRIRPWSRRQQQVLRAQMKARPKRQDSRLSIFATYPWPTAQDFVPVEKVAAAYPDVPIFHSMEEMLRELPTEKPDFTEEQVA